jgi:hypothetical protein
MPLSSIVAEPEELVALSSAFDAAWRQITARSAIDPLRVAAERERLGFIIVTLWKTEPVDNWTTKAVEAFFSAADAAAFGGDRPDHAPSGLDEAPRRDG